MEIDKPFHLFTLLPRIENSFQHSLVRKNGKSRDVDEEIAAAGQNLQEPSKKQEHAEAS